MFLIKYATDVGNTTFSILKLSPGPTEVDYPEKRMLNVKKSQDGVNVIQRPLRDGRPRRWNWVGYTPRIIPFETQWTTLQTLDARERELAGLNPLVFIYEDDSLEGGFDKLSSGTTPTPPNYTNVAWTTVKFINVTRKSRKGGGLVHYDEAYIEFVIEDNTYTRF